MFDAHCHLETVPKLDEALAACRAKLNGLITCGYDLPSSVRNAEIAASNPNYVWACGGLAPQYAMKMNDDEVAKVFGYLREHVDSFVAIGEIGLDYKWAKTEGEKARQKTAFEKQIALANELQKPVVIHSREAEEECVELLLAAKCERVQLHCFSGTAELAKRAADSGWFISIPPLRSKARKQAVKSLELEYLLAESDAPAIGKDPLACLAGAEMIAEEKGMERGEVEAVLEKNCRRLFSI
ncbi:MAG: TatD family hydrolase [Candidatus Burarchaeum sp.]|nr:TatD family hydrolase [Candidatus Burarchaeum sp.]MDO8339316.1 TatD family hydrolase [Candidatus Burarchaeum sp.]